MAVKTITIDLQAYDRLKSVQKPNESFSQTIKRVVHQPFDVDEWLKVVRNNAFSAEAAEAIEQVVKARRSPRNRKR